MGKSTRDSRGFTLIAALLLTVLLSAVAVGLLYLVTNEQRMGGNDLEDNLAFYGAESGIENLTAEVSQLYQTSQSPNGAAITALAAPANYPTNITGSNITNMNYVESITWPATDANGNPCVNPCGTWDIVGGGPDQGMVATVIPLNLTVTATRAAGAGEVTTNAAISPTGRLRQPDSYRGSGFAPSLRVRCLLRRRLRLFCRSELQFRRPRPHQRKSVSRLGLQPYVHRQDRCREPGRNGPAGEWTRHKQWLRRPGVLAQRPHRLPRCPGNRTGCELPSTYGRKLDRRISALSAHPLRRLQRRPKRWLDGYFQVELQRIHRERSNGRDQAAVAFRASRPHRGDRNHSPAASQRYTTIDHFTPARRRKCRLLADLVPICIPDPGAGALPDGQDLPDFPPPAAGGSVALTAGPGSGSYMYYGVATNGVNGWVTPPGSRLHQSLATARRSHRCHSLPGRVAASRISEQRRELDWRHAAVAGIRLRSRLRHAADCPYGTVAACPAYPNTPAGQCYNSISPAILILQQLLPPPLAQTGASSYEATGTNAGGTANNWIPINFYDSREGEPRDNGARTTNTTASTTTRSTPHAAQSES